MCPTHSDISARQMAQITWREFNSFLETGQKWSAQKLSVLFSYAAHFMKNTFSDHNCRLSLALLSVQSVCVFATGVRHKVKERSKRSPRQDREGQTCKAACVKISSARQPEKLLSLTNFSFYYLNMYFPVPGFIASLLREQEPRRLFNIISRAQYIIPLQILVYLHTRLTFMDRDRVRRKHPGKQEKKGCDSSESLLLCCSIALREYLEQISQAKTICAREEATHTSGKSSNSNFYNFITGNYNGI